MPDILHLGSILQHSYGSYQDNLPAAVLPSLRSPDGQKCHHRRRSRHRWMEHVPDLPRYFRLHPSVRLLDRRGHLHRQPPGLVCQRCRQHHHRLDCPHSTSARHKKSQPSQPSKDHPLGRLLPGFLVCILPRRTQDREHTLWLTHPP